MIMKHTFQVAPLTPPSPRSAERYLPSKKLGVRGVRGDTWKVSIAYYQSCSCPQRYGGRTATSISLCSVYCLCTILKKYCLRFGSLVNTSYICTRYLTTDDMLGKEFPHKPVAGQFAKELREALVRARTGNLNQSEIASVRRSEKVLSKYNAVWK